MYYKVTTEQYCELQLEVISFIHSTVGKFEYCSVEVATEHQIQNNVSKMYKNVYKSKHSSLATTSYCAILLD